MKKELKSETNNQWASIPEDPYTKDKTKTKKEKTATDNQWTTTAKNDITEK
ncbi:MAG: hypothetical protein Q8936_09590 [Bacillota bacterium]|nr:hypothetical protein [Bacillota bacterium]